MTINRIKAADNIRNALSSWMSGKDKEKIKSKTRDEILGLQHKTGEEVIDDVTGQRGIILGGSKQNIGVQGTGS